MILNVFKFKKMILNDFFMILLNSSKMILNI